MMTCPKCHAGVPEGMRFCLQCGSALAAAPPPAPARVAANPPVRPAPPVPYPAPPPLPATPPAAEKDSATVPLKIAATPVIAPRQGSPAWQTRPSLGDPVEEIDEEALKKSFERPITHTGAVLCRFCKGPLDLSSDFCDQCGAPVLEAAPPGMVKPRPVLSPVPPPPALPLPHKPAEAVPAARPPAGGAPAARPSPPPPPNPVARPQMPNPPAARPPAPVIPPPPPGLPGEDPPPGLVGRLKGLFKKG